MRFEALRDAVRSLRGAEFDGRMSMVASGQHIEQPEYDRWLPTIGQPHGRHRKVWEWCFILDALDRSALLQPGSTAIGFGVGTVGRRTHCLRSQSARYRPSGRTGWGLG